MNGFYVIVSIPILLVLAGFNHAHGLTTFGKSNGQGQGNTAQQSAGRHCTTQANCTFIKGTTCLRNYCLCGDNTNPANGICSATRKGVGHMCTKDEECVDRAICQDPEEKPKENNPPSLTFKTCQCLENLTPTPRGTCSGGTNLAVIPGLLLTVLSLVLAKVY
ncbi:uncharacterized protein LOC108906241 isoform X2 [Anoplophora glabripennis]|uniref:uncharacterized protein LOC108906241 isoform X2 n=1 Tax=Anoplophora glabripennis TaxID=217634 RepID=UPI0008738C53|nr:uncharacterized protein LOC108906241 isoform X2 [Anoplophora glabripennis]